MCLIEDTLIRQIRQSRKSRQSEVGLETLVFNGESISIAKYKIIEVRRPAEKQTFNFDAQSFVPRSKQSLDVESNASPLVDRSVCKQKSTSGFELPVSLTINLDVFGKSMEINIKKLSVKASVVEHILEGEKVCGRLRGAHSCSAYEKYKLDPYGKLKSRSGWSVFEKKYSEKEGLKDVLSLACDSSKKIVRSEVRGDRLIICINLEQNIGEFHCKEAIEDCQCLMLVCVPKKTDTARVVSCYPCCM